MVMKWVTLWTCANVGTQQLELSPRWPVYVHLSSVHSTKKDCWEMLMCGFENGLIGNQMFRKKQWWNWRILSSICPRGPERPKISPTSHFSILGSVWGGSRHKEQVESKWILYYPLNLYQSLQCKYFSDKLAYRPIPLPLAKSRSNHYLDWLRARTKTKGGESTREEAFHTHTFGLFIHSVH